MIKKIINKIFRIKCIRCNKTIEYSQVHKFHGKFNMCLECYLLANHYDKIQ